VASVSHLTPVHLGLDVHKDTISVAILAPDRDGPDVERITHDEVSVRRLVGRLGDPRWLRACYEAGPTGYDLARLLHTMGVRCEVIAPSLIPKAPGDRVKTDKRDCRRLARLHRAGELVAIRIPASRRRRSATCAGPAPTSSKIAPGPGIACRSSCCATAGPGGVGTPGR
jgi:transposase